MTDSKQNVLNRFEINSSPNFIKSTSHQTAKGTVKYKTEYFNNIDKQEGSNYAEDDR